MKKVTGLGGIFFKCKDPEKTKEWYKKHLGINAGEYGYTFKWKDKDSGSLGTTVWSTFKQDTKYFNPGDKDFMINYRVADLKALLEELKSEGVQIAGEIEEFEYGKFGWIIDPDGQKIELWQPPDDESAEPE